jgi:hypothetical protein
VTLAAFATLAVAIVVRADSVWAKVVGAVGLVFFGAVLVDFFRTRRT